MRELYVDTREGAACFRTISEAVASLPSENKELTVIHVAPGIYEERLTIETPFIVLEGSGAQQTRVTGNLGAYELLEDGTKRGTFRTQTVLVSRCMRTETVFHLKMQTSSASRILSLRDRFP